MLYDLFLEPLQHEWMIRGLLVSTLVSLTLACSVPSSYCDGCH